MKKITISGSGCALADFLYTNVSFSSIAFKKYLSKKIGDGGLSPGRLVFTEELEKFSGCSYNKILDEITGGKAPAGFNIGGPSLVSLIHASQMLDPDFYSVRFYGTAGNDETGRKILTQAGKTPLNVANYRTIGSKASPFTDVLSDPLYDNGHGERTFVNNIGAAWDYHPEFLEKGFYKSDIVCLGGTALVPQIHDNLTSILGRAKNNGCITVVNTVFDFRNEKKNPGAPWPLGDSRKSLALIDILIMDREESVKISGQATFENTTDWFINSGVSSFIITNGANELYAWSGGAFFTRTDLLRLPVSNIVTNDLKENPELRGDTTGCGDNFAGGIIASVAMQLKEKKPAPPDLHEALSWGVASGGFCCYTLGGTYIEKSRGEKLNLVRNIQGEYLKQIGR